MSDRVIKVDDTFGRLTVREVLNERLLLCVCECGKQVQLRRSTLLLPRKSALSCGCGVVHRQPKSHNHCGWEYASEFQRWRIARSQNRLCPAWREDFATFLAGVQQLPGYAALRQERLERLDKSKPFGPDNAQWVAQRTVRKEKKHTVSAKPVAPVHLRVGSLAYIVSDAVATVKVDSITVAWNSSGQRVRFTFDTAGLFEADVTEGWSSNLESVVLEGDGRSLCFTKATASGVARKQRKVKEDAEWVSSFTVEGTPERAEVLAQVRKMLEGLK